MVRGCPVKKIKNESGWRTRQALRRLFSGGILVFGDPRGDNNTPLRAPDFHYSVVDGDVGAGYLELLHSIYDLKIGELGTHWSHSMPIDFQHVKIKIGDVIDFYTDSKGVLHVPDWACFKYAVDDYLERM